MLQTRKYRDACVPYSRQTISYPEYSEDCLYINITTPNSPSKDPKGYPVLVYIHGGGFCFGSAPEIGYDKITRNFVSRGLIVVAIPYRVGIYGSFSN